MRRLVFSKEAAADIKASFLWYESHRLGLGREFRLALDAATSRIQRSPEHFRIIVEPFRRALLRRFPFEVFFSFDDDRVVYLVFHTSLDPAKWQERLGPT